MKVEFINFNRDPKLDPQLQSIPLSEDSVNKPPAYCLPFVQAMDFAIQLKANHHYKVRRRGGRIEACVLAGGEVVEPPELFIEMPEDVSFLPRNEDESKNHRLRLSEALNFSSPWQEKRAHSVTLKLGICWWTPPGWAMFFCSPTHRTLNYKVTEGLVRTDLWHRDIPVLIEPLSDEEVDIPKYSVVASALLVPVDGPELVSAQGDPAKLEEIALQTSQKRARKSIYKELVLKKRK